MSSRKDFEEELTKLINHHNMEAGSDTPDYILAGYLMRCLDAWNCSVSDRKYWFRRPPTKIVEEGPTIDRVPSSLRKEG